MSNFQPVFRTLLCLSCAAFAHAQSPSEPARFQRLDIVAVDNTGQGAAGLTAADFQVTDQGKAQKIVLFRGATPAPSAQQFANQTGPGGRATAILLDFFAQNSGERQDDVRKLGPSLKGMESAEGLFLYLLAPDGSLVPVHEIPKDPAAPQDKGWTKDIDKQFAGLLKQYNKQRPSGISDEDVVKKTYVALESISNQLAQFPGRHDIIWVTGWPANVSNPKSTCSGDWVDCGLYIPHLTVTLDRSGTMIDPIYYGTANVDQSQHLEDVALLTGGKPYLGQDVSEVLKQWSNQAAGAYSVAYDPSAANWDNKYHKIKVTCSRPGVKVQVKQRYYAVPDQNPMPQRQQNMMVTAYKSVGDVADVGIRATVSKGSAPNAIKVEMRLNPSDLVLHENAGQMTDTITLVYSTRTAAGPQGDPTVGDMEVKVAKDQMADGILIAKEFPIDGATTKVRFIVLDKSSDAVGSLTVPVSK